ncbi:rhamnosyltransferase [uncultured bacterium]|nr:rhamnosyltransferase [uncultured bacterium]
MKVTVLMSTYNGGQFLPAQLNSLYTQTHKNLKILVRDDGSQDNTLSILKAEQAQNKIELLESQGNLGATGSFFTLLQAAANTDTDYVAFCDQDDIWEQDKIKRAVSLLKDIEKPALYCSRLSVVNEELNFLHHSLQPRKIGFGNALVENIAVGCTMVLNRQAMDLLCQKRLPHEVSIHDWWCYLVISALGTVIFDNEAFIKYRQHSNNVIGIASNWCAVLRRKFARLLSDRLWISEQAWVLHELFAEELADNQRALLELLLKAKASFWYRVRLALSANVWRQKFIDNIILRLVILLNRI